MEGTVNSIEKLCDEVETVNGFRYLEDRLNSSGGCEAPVTARARIVCVRFRERGEFSFRNRLKMKGKVYRCCVRSAILRKKECAICGRKVVDRKTTEEEMDMLGLKETTDELATANGVRLDVDMC